MTKTAKKQQSPLALTIDEDVTIETVAPGDESIGPNFDAIPGNEEMTFEQREKLLREMARESTRRVGWNL